MLSASLRYFFPMKQKPEAPGGEVTVFYCKGKAKIHYHWGQGRRKIPLFLGEGKKYHRGLRILYLCKVRSVLPIGW